MIKLINRNNYKESHTFSLFTILFLISITIYNMIAMISDHSSYAKLLNVSGKQRMLSQRITLLATQYQKNEQSEIVNLLKEFKDNHDFLTDRKLSDKLENVYFDNPHNLDKVLINFIELNKRYIKDYKSSDLSQIIKIQDEILHSLDTVVHLIEDESKEFSDFMIIVEILIIFFIALLLYMESKYIFKPMLRRIEKEREKESINKKKLEVLVHKKTKSLEESLEIINHYVFSSKTDLTGTITYVSDAFCELSGYSKEELIGKTHSVIKHPDNPSSAFKKLWDVLTSGETYRGEVKNMKKNGDDFWLNSLIRPEYNDKSEMIGYIAYRKNITHEKTLENMNMQLEKMVEKKTKELKYTNERLLKLSQTDTLTGIYNRKKLQESLALEIKKSYRYDQVFSIILVDIDHFKNVNDTYGHLTGDNVIKGICDLISNNIRDIDLFARWGGEEFVIMITNQNKNEAKQLAEKIRVQINTTKIDNLDITCSFGISQYEQGDNDKMIFKKADEALYQAKETGRNKVIIG